MRSGLVAPGEHIWALMIWACRGDLKERPTQLELSTTKVAMTQRKAVFYSARVQYSNATISHLGETSEFSPSNHKIFTKAHTTIYRDQLPSW